MQNNLFSINKDTKEKNKKIVDKLKNKNKKVSTRTSTDIPSIIEKCRVELADKLGEYILIDSNEKLKKYVDRIISNNMFTLDVESTGLDPIDDDLVGFSLHTPDYKSCYIPIYHTNYSGQMIEGVIDKDFIAQQLKRLKDSKCIYHNSVFDMRFIYNEFNIWIDCYWDTMLASKYLNELEETAKLKSLYDKYIGKDTNSLKFGDLFVDIGFNMVPLDIATAYGANDSKITYELYKFQYDYLHPDGKYTKETGLEKAGKFFIEVEMPLTRVVAEMEQEGIPLDKELASELLKDYNSKLFDIENKINDIINKMDLQLLPMSKSAKLSNPVNLSSPIQLAIIIYDYLGLKHNVKKESKRGTGESILKYFSENNKGELFDYLLDYRQYEKLITTYIKKLPKIVKEDGKIHCNFNQFGAKTGRFSSSNPNMQNIPTSDYRIRQMFKAPEGYVFIASDFSQQEPRILAHLSQDTNMIQAYKDGRDLYATVASKIFKVPYEDCQEYKNGEYNEQGKKRRDMVKGIVLGLMYSRGTKSIAESLGVTYKEANSFVNDFFGNFPSIKKVIEEQKNYVRRNGFVYTLYGRKRRLPEFNLPEYEFESVDGELSQIDIIRWKELLRSCHYSKKNTIKKEAKKSGVIIKDNGAKKADAERQILNSIIQGTASDMTKKAMLALYNNQELKSLGYKILLTIHDEVLGKCPKENAKRCEKIVRELMVKAGEGVISVPMKVDIDIVDRWYGTY